MFRRRMLRIVVCIADLRVSVQRYFNHLTALRSLCLAKKTNKQTNRIEKQAHFLNEIISLNNTSFWFFQLLFCCCCCRCFLFSFFEFFCRLKTQNLVPQANSYLQALFALTMIILITNFRGKQFRNCMKRNFGPASHCVRWWRTITGCQPLYTHKMKLCTKNN